MYTKVILIRKLACYKLLGATHKNGTKRSSRQKLNALLCSLAPSIHWASHWGGGPGATYQYIVFVLYFYCICGPAASYQWIPPLQSTALWRRWSPGWVINRLHIVKTADDQIMGSLKANRRVTIDHTNSVTLQRHADQPPLFFFNPIDARLWQMWSLTPYMGVIIRPYVSYMTSTCSCSSMWAINNKFWSSEQWSFTTCMFVYILVRKSNKVSKHNVSLGTSNHLSVGKKLQWTDFLLLLHINAQVSLHSTAT